MKEVPFPRPFLVLSLPLPFSALNSYMVALEDVWNVGSRYGHALPGIWAVWEW